MVHATDDVAKHTQKIKARRTPRRTGVMVTILAAATGDYVAVHRFVGDVQSSARQTVEEFARVRPREVVANSS